MSHTILPRDRTTQSSLRKQQKEIALARSEYKAARREWYAAKRLESEASTFQSRCRLGRLSGEAMHARYRIDDAIRYMEVSKKIAAEMESGARNALGLKQTA